MAKDALLKLTTALPNASASSFTNVIDLGSSPATEVWRLGFVEIGFPAIAGHTNTTANVAIDLYHGVDSNTANHTLTNVTIELLVPGVASTGSAVKTALMPLPPDVKRYISFKQTATANANTGPNSNVTYELVTRP